MNDIRTRAAPVDRVDPSCAPSARGGSLATPAYRNTAFIEQVSTMLYQHLFSISLSHENASGLSVHRRVGRGSSPLPRRGSRTIHRTTKGGGGERTHRSEGDTKAKLKTHFA